MKLVSEKEALEDLANAVIQLAIKDYEYVLRYLKRHPENEAALQEAERLEDFFYGQWFELITDAEPNYILPRLWEKYDIDREMRTR